MNQSDRGDARLTRIDARLYPHPRGAYPQRKDLNLVLKVVYRPGSIPKTLRIFSPEGDESRPVHQRTGRSVLPPQDRRLTDAHRHLEKFGKCYAVLDGLLVGREGFKHSTKKRGLGRELNPGPPPCGSSAHARDIGYTLRRNHTTRPPSR